MFQVQTLNKNKNTEWFNSASQVALQCMMSDWAHVQGSSVDNTSMMSKRNIRNLSLAYPNICIRS